MSVRQLLRESRLLSVIIILVCVGAAAAIAFLRGGSSSPPGPARYFYDLNKKELLIAPDAVPPIAVKASGKTDKAGGVRAYVFACTSCADEKDRFVGYLHTYEASVK